MQQSFKPKLMRRTNKGASLLSYGLIVGLISVVALSAVTSVGSNVDSLMTDVGDSLSSVTGANGAATPIPDVLASCADLGSTGSWDIDPDGAGPIAQRTTNCENDTQGGGWTQVDVTTPQDFIDAVSGSSAQMMVKCANLGLSSSTYVMSPDSGLSFNFTDDQVVSGTWNFSGVPATCGSNGEVGLAVSWGFSCSEGPGNNTKFYPGYVSGFTSDPSDNDSGLVTVDANGPPTGDANIDVCGTGSFFADWLIFVR